MHTQTSVVIVADQPLYGEGLRLSLEAHDDFDVLHRTSTRVALKWGLPNHPDVVVWSPGEPDSSETALESRWCAPVVAVGPDCPSVRIRAAHAGASACAPEWALAETVRAVVEGRARRSRMEPAARAHELMISPREGQILQLVVMAYSNREIADLLGIAEQTVKNRVHRLMHKVGAGSRLQLAKWAVECSELRLSWHA